MFNLADIFAQQEHPDAVKFIIDFYVIQKIVKNPTVATRAQKNRELLRVY
jgi:hypothetical protein